MAKQSVSEIPVFWTYYLKWHIGWSVIWMFLTLEFDSTANIKTGKVNNNDENQTE